MATRARCTTSALALSCCLTTVTACGRDATPSLPPTHEEIAVPAVAPPGFTVLPLVAFDPAARRDSSAARGEFWYRFGDDALEWFVRGSGLRPGRAYRVEFEIDDGNSYAVDSRRADAHGVLLAHGIETAFENKVCVGDDAAVPRPLTGGARLHVAVKSDGAATQGGVGGGMVTSSARELPCSGNGDGVFDYALVGTHDLSIGASEQP